MRSILRREAGIAQHLLQIIDEMGARRAPAMRPKFFFARALEKDVSPEARHGRRTGPCASSSQGRFTQIDPIRVVMAEFGLMADDHDRASLGPAAAQESLEATDHVGVG